MKMRDDSGQKHAWLAGGYLPAGKKIAAVITAVMTLAVLILRVALTPRMQDPDTGLFHLSYLIIGLMALTMLAAAVLSWLSQNDGVPPGGKLLTPLSLSAMLAGSVMTIVSALDGFNWLLFGETPAPNEHVISGIDGVTLFFTIVFGLLGGVMLVRTGIVWLTENRVRSGLMRLWALAPVGWVWMRLARYEVSYASAVAVSESFYDFVMLIFIMLFFLFFARFAAGVGNPRPRLLVGVSLSAALCALTGPATHFIMFAMGNPDAAEACALATPVDFCIGLFALAFAYAQAYGRPYAPQPAEPEPDPPAEPERAEEAVSAPEIPPVSESQWTRTEIPVDPQPEKQPDVEAILKDYSSKTE